MKLKNNITLKILINMSVCIILFTFFGVLTASALYSSRLAQRSRQINEQYLTVITNQIENDILELQKLSGLCASSFSITESMRSNDPLSVQERHKYLTAQDKMDTIASTTPLSNYLERFAIINKKGIHISSFAGKSWNSEEWVTLTDYVQNLDNDDRHSVFQWDSIVNSSLHNLTYLAPISGVTDSYLYVELNESILTEQLLPYKNLQKIFIADTDGLRMLSTFASSEDDVNADFLSPSGTEITYDGNSYKISAIPISRFDLIAGCLNDTALNGGDKLYMLYVLLILLATTACAGFLVTRILSRRITKPIQILTEHIRHLSKGHDFTVNPEIESSHDEIGEIGHTVNKLTTHVQTLLDEQAKMYEQKKNTEINLLQSQINPHFLYNTLDSIRWMAVIQGAKNIEQTTKALSNLLRNMAKGVGDKVTLREELKLVADYVHIQQVRYVEIFDYICQVPEELLDCRIIKFTLQPIVENAILHGIEPTGRFGQISITAREENSDLIITVEDDGAGMSPEELEELRATLSRADSNCLNGIGVSNVDTRLKLYYGSEHGLTYESSPDTYTRVTINIPKEVSPNV